MTPPAYGFRLSGLRLESNTSAVVQLGLYNTATFFELWRTQATKTAYAQAIAKWDTPDGFLSVPVGNGFVPAFQLLAAPGGSVLLTGELRIASVDTIAPANTVANPSGAPTVVSAAVSSNGTTFTPTFSVAVSLSSGVGITITDGTNTYTATYVSGTGTTTPVFTSSGTILQGDVVTWSYVSSSGNIVSTSGSIPLASFTNDPVTNNSTQPGGIPLLTGALYQIFHM
jgi:hypothetical protein